MENRVQISNPPVSNSVSPCPRTKNGHSGFGSEKSVEQAKRILWLGAENPQEKDLAGIFRDLNYQVIGVNDQQEANNQLSESPVDLILASAGNGGQGLEFCDVVRSDPRIQNTPVIILGGSADAAQLFAEHKTGSTPANNYLMLPLEPEDLIDAVEKLIGLPGGGPVTPPAKPVDSVSQTAPEAKNTGDAEMLQREVEELREQIHFYEKKLGEVSFAGEKDDREMDTFLHELQEEVEKQKKEKTQFKNELTLQVEELGKRDREIQNRDKMVAETQEDLRKVQGSLQKELEELRTTLNDAEDKHKRAQNALREYYKPKVARASKLEKKLSLMNEEYGSSKEKLEGLKEKVRAKDAEIEELKDRVEGLKSRTSQFKEQLEREQEKSEKAREALENASRALG